MITTIQKKKASELNIALLEQVIIGWDGQIGPNSIGIHVLYQKYEPAKAEIKRANSITYQINRNVRLFDLL
jgi:hypothetical protein